MIQEQSRLFQRILMLIDFMIINISWIAAYYIRFEIMIPPEWKSLASYSEYLVGIVPVSMAIFMGSGLYASDRARRLPLMIFSVARAVFLGLVGIVGALFFYRAFSFSRVHMMFFGLIALSLMIGFRLAVYLYVRRSRRRGKFIKRVLIVGDGPAGRRLAESFRHYPWMGLKVVGFVDNKLQSDDILGTVGQTPKLMDDFEAAGRPIDYVYITLSPEQNDSLHLLLDNLSTRLAHVCLVPDLFQYNILNSRLTDLDGIPIIHLFDETPFDFRRLTKRTVDIVFSGLFLTLISPILLTIALAVKLSSKGPVLYKQERMGLNGQMFKIMKFRSMPTTAESASGPVWAQGGENRATKVGAFLRKTSLDELPQFFNVLKGDMSVVGPRPERPVFIHDFKNRVPGYMLRHKMKAGITGWAQINGWRGNTSIEKRIEFDLYYIQHWSLALDIKIMWLTFWKGFVNENAY